MNYWVLFFCFFIGSLWGKLPCDPQAQVIIMRHGESDHNLTNIYNSNPDSPIYKSSYLTDKGKQQVKSASESLQKQGYNKKNIVAVYVSPLPRTIQTAEVLARSDLFEQNKIIIDPRLTETHFASLEGHTEIQDPKELIRDFKANGVETDLSIDKRLNDFYQSLLISNPCGHVIIITHAYNVQKLLKIIGNKQIDLPENSAIKIEPLNRGNNGVN